MMKDDFYKDYKLLDYKFIVVNRTTLQPMVWDFNKTQVVGTLILHTPSGFIYRLRDPYEIGAELQYYLDNPDIQVPVGMQSSNDIVKFIEEY